MRQSIVAWLLIGCGVVVALAAGCSSSHDSSPAPAVAGLYTASGSGPVRTISFNGSQYTLQRSAPCNVCTDTGTFELSGDTLTLTSDVTHARLRVPITVLASTDGAVSTSAFDPSMHTLDDTPSPGGSLVSGGTSLRSLVSVFKVSWGSSGSGSSGGVNSSNGAGGLVNDSIQTLVGNGGCGSDQGQTPCKKYGETCASATECLSNFCVGC